MILGLYAALLGLMSIYLSLKVSMARAKYKVSLGDGGNMNLLKKIRAHGNFIEYTPIFLILFAICDFIGLRGCYLHFFGASFVIGRMSHAWGVCHAEVSKNKVSNAKPIFIMLGMVITHLTIGILSIMLIVNFMHD